MIIASPAQKVDPARIGKDKPFQVLEGSVIRVRLHVDQGDIETQGQLAIPVYVVNEDPEYKREWFLDPEEPIDLVLRYDLPLTGGLAIPVYLVEHDDGGSLQIQSGETEETEGYGDQATGEECGFSDWSGSASGLSAYGSNVGTSTEIRVANLRASG